MQRKWNLAAMSAAVSPMLIESWQTDRRETKTLVQFVVENAEMLKISESKDKRKFAWHHCYKILKLPPKCRLWTC